MEPRPAVDPRLAPAAVLIAKEEGRHRRCSGRKGELRESQWKREPLLHHHRAFIIAEPPFKIVIVTGLLEILNFCRNLHNVELAVTGATLDVILSWKEREGELEKRELREGELEKRELTTISSCPLFPVLLLHSQ
ncbi:hypothetical protein AHAS_Ahas15G0308900 [Arachis hypogaea]